MAATVETIDGRDMMYIVDPFTRQLLEEILEVLRARAEAELNRTVDAAGSGGLTDA